MRESAYKNPDMVPFGWKKEVKLDKDLAADEIILEEEILDQLIEESNEE
jgi:hypothetical protein